MASECAFAYIVHFLFTLECGLYHNLLFVKYTVKPTLKAGVWKCHARLVRIVHITDRTSKFLCIGCLWTSENCPCSLGGEIKFLLIIVKRSSNTTKQKSVTMSVKKFMTKNRSIV